MLKPNVKMIMFVYFIIPEETGPFLQTPPGGAQDWRAGLVRSSVLRGSSRGQMSLVSPIWDALSRSPKQSVLEQ